MGGILNRLFGHSAVLPRGAAVEATRFGGDDTLEVVGESRYQDALWMIVGGRSPEPVRRSVKAVLIPEPTNPYDENAIRVTIDGSTVGYLFREDAAVYRPGLLALMEQCAGRNVALAGQIVGGGPRDGGLGSLGVFLDHDPSDFGVSPREAGSGSVDLGWSTAIDQDADDDSYDLSWSRGLSDDDHTAIRQLERLLDDERDPVDRHFIFNLLAERLYRRRDEDPDALSRFDGVCEVHHSEMEAIRPELLRLFKGLPRVPMYRQVVIRHQKARNWEQALIWAERGLSFYGSDAIRHENADDMRKRVAHAKAKFAPPATKRTTRSTRSGSGVTSGRSPQIETLVCATCGTTFDRVVMRGRKPTQCASCRGSTSSDESQR